MQEENKIASIETFEELKQLKSALIEEAKSCLNPNDWKEGSDKFKEFRKRWNDLSANAAIIVEEEDSKLNEKFNKVCDAFYENREKHYQQIEVEKVNNAKRKWVLIEELKQIVSENKEIESFERIKEITEEYKKIGQIPVKEADDLFKTYHLYMDQISGSIKDYYALKDLDRKKNYQEKLLLCEQAENLANETDAKTASQQIRTLHELWKEIGPVPQEYNAEIWERFKKASDVINGKYEEYQKQVDVEYAENLVKKEALCAEIEAFVAGLQEEKSPRWKELVVQINGFEEKWEAIGYVPKDNTEAIRKRYKAAISAFYNKQREYFKRKDEERQDAIKQKTALIEAVEALKDSTNWEETAEKLKQYQDEWKKTSYVNEKDSKPLWDRFRSACDFFFSERKKHLDSQDGERMKFLEAKQAICEEIEKFLEEDPTEEHTQKVKEYQKNWKTLGEVPIKEKNKIWNRFSKACDDYFDHLRANKKSGGGNFNKIKTQEYQHQNSNMSAEESKLDKQMKTLLQEKGQLENNIEFFAKGKSGDAMRKSIQEKIDALEVEIKKIKDEMKAIRKAAQEAKKQEETKETTTEEQPIIEENKVEIGRAHV